MSSDTSKRLRVGIIQSNYIPWKGYFDFIASCDVFVILDEVQYTRRDWRNRNVIKTSNGPHWLTIPVAVKGRYEQAINETRISDPTWAANHLRTLRHAYGRAEHFAHLWPFVENLYGSVAGEPSLSRVNETLLRSLAAHLRIATPIRRSEEFAAASGKNERLISICTELGANEYLSGPSARGYIDESLWTAAGITVRYKSYDRYPIYKQLHQPFDHYVSVLDLLFNAGLQAPRYLRSLTATDDEVA